MAPVLTMLTRVIVTATSTVRAAAGGRFVAGAAVSYEQLDVGGYWTAGCERVA